MARHGVASLCRLRFAARNVLGPESVEVTNIASCTQTFGGTRRLHNNSSTGGTSRDNLPEISSTVPYLGQGVQIGQVASTERTYSTADVNQFSICVQDYNPLHTAMDWESAVEENQFWEIHEQNQLIRMDDENSKTQDGMTITKPIVHGMLVSSIFSSIFATVSPGCIYMNQTLSFECPVYVGDRVMGKIEIERIRKWRKGGVVVQCETEAVVLPRDSTVVKGTANVWLPSGYTA